MIFPFKIKLIIFIKKKIKKKKKTNKYPNDKIELLDYFLSFVETDSELNYVLTGYFCKFLIMLFLKKPITLINYFSNNRILID